eukprot:GCRY01001068.1.p2 GENE.GCRY01001068.1~~GCRY01001068.1.p2  ORF type:complete len:111 (+),score=25.09 GCRY01001068.1:269-601(+)
MSDSSKEALAEFFSSASQLVNGESNVVNEDVVLLEEMNVLTAKKVVSMKGEVKSLAELMENFRDQYNELVATFEKIATLDTSVQELEVVVKGIDQQTKKLESRLKSKLRV